MADILTDADLINTLRLIRDKAPAGAAKALGINLGDLFRRSLDEALLKRKKSCPTCGKKRG